MFPTLIDTPRKQRTFIAEKESAREKQRKSESNKNADNQPVSFWAWPPAALPRTNWRRARVAVRLAAAAAAASAAAALAAYRRHLAREAVGAVAAQRLLPPAAAAAASWAGPWAAVAAARGRRSQRRLAGPGQPLGCWVHCHREHKR